MIEPKNILITGGTGFVGANLVRRLVKEKNNLHLIIRKNYDKWRIKDISKNVNFHYVDLNNQKEVEKVVNKVNPKIIYHLAAYGNYLEESRKNLETDIFGTLNLLNACNEIGYDVFINTGSSSEYGMKNRAMKESDLIEPNSYYAIAKATQSLLSQYLGRDKGLPIITLRLFSVYGPYEMYHRLIPTLIKNSLNGKDLKLASPKTARDFIFVEDVVDAYIKASRMPKLAGHIFNIGTGKQSSLKEIVSIIIDLTNSKAKQKWGTYPDRSFDASIWVADISKANRMLKWYPKHNLRQGLKKTIDWFKKNNY
ncbi:MAG: NAD-dependent epimerase/dehydratase family protein [Patescibacteria group bacterium]